MQDVNDQSRFYCPSSRLDTGELLAKAQRILALFAGCAVAAHLAITQIGGFSTAQRTVEPLTTRFIKREPRLTKPLEMKKQPRPRRPRLQRQMIYVRAQAKQGAVRSAFRAAQVLQSLTRPNANLERYARFQEVGPVSYTHLRAHET